MMRQSCTQPMRKHIVYGVLPVVVVALAIGIFYGCREWQKEDTFVVGVSIDFDDVWHNKMIDEIEQEAVLHPELSLRLLNACGDYALQEKQIIALADKGADLLIVGTGDPMYVREALDYVAAKGVPVVINSHNPQEDEYTAYVGTDNHAAGLMMGQYLAEHAKQARRTAQHPLRAIEVVGVMGTPAVDERYNGLREYLEGHREVEITAVAQADWKYEKARYLTDSLLQVLPDIDIIVAQSDIMAFGAYEAGKARFPEKDFHILGVDALSGKGSGVEAILEGKIEASITNVSRGDLMVQTACDILHGKPFVRDMFLQPVLVDQSSKRLMMRMSEELNNESKVIQTLQLRMDNLWGEADTLKNTNAVLIFCLLLLILLTGVVIFLCRYRLRIHQERAQNAIVLERQQRQLDKISAELCQVKATQTQDEKFINNLQEFINKHLSDPELSIEMLSGELGLSRAQLFRKVKAKLGVSPVDLIRQIRMQKAQQMFRRTDLSVSEVAYSVGFSSSSYFSKCYKDYFGVAPKQLRQDKSSIEVHETES
mgnify:FL=1